MYKTKKPAQALLNVLDCKEQQFCQNTLPKIIIVLQYYRTFII